MEELWLSQAPPGERLDEYVRKEWNHEPHVGETPVSVSADAVNFAKTAHWSIVGPEVSYSVKQNRAEYERLRQDIECIWLLAKSYAAKSDAAMHVLRFNYSQETNDLNAAAVALSTSKVDFESLAWNAQRTYHFANSMQTGHRKIPFPGAANGVGTNYHWTQVLPLYEKELADFKAQVAERRAPSRPDTNGQQQAETVLGAPIAAWPAAKFKLLSTNAETYEVKVGAQPYADRKYTITGLASELNGLTGIRFSHETAKNGRYEPIEFETVEPVRVLAGYFQSDRNICLLLETLFQETWLQEPQRKGAMRATE